MSKIRELSLKHSKLIWFMSWPLVTIQVFISISRGLSMEVSKVTQSCPTLCDPVDCSPSGSSDHGILQATILEWVAISFSRGSSQPRDRTRVSHIGGRRFNLWATREALENPPNTPRPGRQPRKNWPVTLYSHGEFPWSGFIFCLQSSGFAVEAR